MGKTWKITLDILNVYFIFFYSPIDQAHCTSATNQMGLLFRSVHTFPGWEFNVAATAIWCKCRSEIPFARANVTANVCKPIIFFEGGEKAAAGQRRGVKGFGVNRHQQRQVDGTMVLNGPRTIRYSNRCVRGCCEVRRGWRREKAGSPAVGLAEGGSRGTGAVRGRQNSPNKMVISVCGS